MFDDLDDDDSTYTHVRSIDESQRLNRSVDLAGLVGGRTVTNSVVGVAWNASNRRSVLQPGQRVELELVPEPSNKMDHRVVTVDHDGVRIGYIRATIAAHFHDVIHHLNVSDGVRVLVPA